MSFVCLKVVDGVCRLSDKTGSDVGGLYYGATQEVHHFEMKPILGEKRCGGLIWILIMSLCFLGRRDTGECAVSLQTVERT